MRKGLLTAVAAVALVTGGGVAAAQSMDNSRGGATGAPQSTIQRPPGMAQNPSERGTMQTPIQGRSGAVEERGRRSGERDMMQSPTQGRSVGSETLSRDQRSRLHESIIGGNLHRADRVDFALSVGTRIPDTVEVYGLPETVVDIVPQYAASNTLLPKMNSSSSIRKRLKSSRFFRFDSAFR